MADTHPAARIFGGDAGEVCAQTRTREAMTQPDRINLLDTDYATLIATDYDPNLERLMRAAGESPRDAVLLTRLVGLAQKPIETEEDWQEFEAVWGKLEKNE